MASVNLDAAQVGVVALQAGTPEALTSVMDKWLDEHFGTEVLSIEMQVVGNGTITVMVVYRRDRTMRR
jgi:hypothetical protein